MFLTKLYYILPVFLITGPFLSDLLISLTSLYFLFYFFKIDRTFLKTKLNYYFLFFFLFLITLSFFSTDNFTSFKSTLPYFRFLMFSLIICYCLEKKILKLNIFFFIISIIIFLIFIDTLYQFKFEKNLLGQTSPLVYRVTSFFGDEAVLGSYVIKLYILFCFLDHLIKYKYKLYLFFIITIMSVSIITMSGDRTPFYLLIIFFSIMLFFSGRKKQYLVSIILFFVASLVFLSTSTILKNRLIFMTNEGFFDTLDKFEQHKITDKIDYNFPNVNNFKYYISQDHHSHFVASKEIFFDNFLFGSGPNTFRIECKKEKYIKNNDKGCSTHPHNFYFQLSSETGIIGLLSILSIFLISTYNIISLFFNKNDFDFGKLIIFTYLFLILFPLSPNGNFFNNWLSILNYFPLGFFIYYFRNFDYLKSK